MGKLIYGNQNLGYAPIVNSQGTYSFGTPVILKGMVSASAEVEESSSNIYADNKIYCVVSGAKTQNLTTVVRYITEEYAQFLGFKLEANGMLVDTGNKPSHCVFFETLENDCETNEETRTLHYFYNVKASQPNVESSTTEEEIEGAELSIEYVGLTSEFVADSDGKLVGYGKITRTDANKTLYDSFLTKVILPTDSI